MLFGTGISLHKNDDWSIFPPRDHEGLDHQIPFTEIQRQDGCCNDEDSKSPSSTSGREYWDMRFVGKIVRTNVELISSKICFLWNRWLAKKGDGVGGFGVGFGVGFVALAVGLWYVRYKHRRERVRFLLLLQEKDAMIANLSNRQKKISSANFN
ncbi:hypothetical protein ZOSMA_160G00280 [Zostera marina]|uniref:Transmembrane protein n=1 Tax=Zostera marina TaxID=29655 RepID=A0A0K9PWQ4_ZOSMR|nr:hypothetical protein ZOSMA_160G00280 [Zostera marina]